MKLILIGATGLVGSQVLKLALENEKVEKVIALTRTPLDTHPKLVNEIVNFDHLPDKEFLWQGDALICTLGSTIKKAKTKENFKRVDFDYPLEAARLAKKYGTSCYILNSAKGASRHSLFFYSRVKGELEEELKKLSFPSLIIVRPGLIGGKRNEPRPAEEMAQCFYKVFNPFLPAKMKINPAFKIAQTLLEKALVKKLGVEIIESEEMA